LSSFLKHIDIHFNYSILISDYWYFNEIFEVKKNLGMAFA